MVKRFLLGFSLGVIWVSAAYAWLGNDWRVFALMLFASITTRIADLLSENPFAQD